MALDSVKHAAQNAYVLAWDVALALYNLVTPNLKPGHVTPKGESGSDGDWPEYVAPREGDSRSACPALNALANHGLLPHDGRNIAFKELERVVRKVYNFAPSFCYFVPNYSARMLNKQYSTDSFDLAELSLHNGIEHDASLTRRDVHLEPNQGKPHLPYVKELLNSATGEDKDGNPVLTIPDLSKISSKRRAEARRENPEFSLSTFHKMFGSSNSSTLLTIFGGRVKDLEAMLVDERIPNGWESRVMSRKGLTLTAFNFTVSKVEKGIDESRFPAESK